MVLVALATGWLSLDLRAGERGLLISLKPEKSSYALGEPIDVSLVFFNRSGRPFLIERPRGLGPKNLMIVARKGECITKTESVHFDVAVDDLRFFLVPLLSGDTLTTPLPAFNDSYGLDTLLLFEEGDYHVTATFYSEGPQQDSRPIWRGETSSEPAQISIDPPDPQATREMTERLKSCYAMDACIDVEAVEYFRLVRHEPASCLLRKILIRDHGINPRIGEAVAHQGSSEDIEALAKVAHMYEGDMKSYFEDLTRRAKERDRCQQE